MIGQHPLQEAGKMAKPPVFFRAMSPSLTDTIEKVLKPEFMKWIPADYFDRYDSKHRILYLKKNCPAKGSKVEFMSYDQDIESFGGGDRSGLLCDEPPPMDRYNESTARLREAEGRVLIGMTPVKSNRNIRWMFLDMIEPGKCSVYYGDCMELMNLRFGTEKAEEVFARISANWSKEETLIRRFGKFPVLEGVVWDFKKSLAPKGHLIQDFKIPNDYMIVMSMDYHPRTAVHCLYCAISPQNVHYYFKEYVSLPGRTDRQIAEDLAAIEEDFPTPVYARLVDPSSSHTPNRQEEHATPLRTFGQFRSRGKRIIFRSAIRKVECGINCVAERLRFDKQGYPGAYFFQNSVPITIDQITHYIYGEWAVGGDMKDAKQEPLKKEDHQCDNVRYIESQRFKYSHPQLKMLRDKIRFHTPGVAHAS
jgi:phage terminase large subunit-like protein